MDYQQLITFIMEMIGTIAFAASGAMVAVDRAMDIFGVIVLGVTTAVGGGEDEVIEFKHTAYSKAIFGKGAIEAAKFLAGKPAGKYDMADVIEG